MIYSSLLFIYAFLPVSVLLYALTPKKLKNGMLLLISGAFCGLVGMRYLAFIAAYSLWNLVMADSVYRLRKHKALAAIPLTVGITGSIAAALIFTTDYFDEILSILMLPRDFFPVGISFMMLSAVGSLIDIYSGKAETQPKAVTYLLYLMFFPKLFFGPIVNLSSFTKMAESRRFSLSETGAGLSLFVTGLAKRVILAGSLYQLYSAVNSMNVREISALSAWLGLTAYILCLYFTLSGYADMGAGVARCLGYRLPNSFNYPCFCGGIENFCRRWHTPVVRWFNRIIYKPTASTVKLRMLLSVMFIVSWGMIGLWYGFTLNKLIWGLLIGTAAVLERLLLTRKPLSATSIIYTTIVISFCMVFFAGASMKDSLLYLFAMIGGNNNLADSESFYLLKSYLVVLLVSVYASTDMFRNLTERTKNKALKVTASFLTPIVNAALLILCTAMLTHDGSAEMLLLRL